MIPNRTRFTYGVDGLSEWIATYPPAPWHPVDDPKGVTRWTADGTPGPVVDRRDALLTLPLRVLETEWLAFLAFVEFAQGADPVNWYPDADEGTGFLVYLESPALGDDWTPSVNAEFPRLFDVEITLRGEGITLPWREYFEVGDG